MGVFSSKEEKEREEIQSSYDPKNIYYDIYGNLRYGVVLNDIVEEMRRMILNDSIAEVQPYFTSSFPYFYLLLYTFLAYSTPSFLFLTLLLSCCVFL